jgi:hypothetical protein
MFWHAITGGVQLLAQWEVWAGAIACGLAVLASQMGVVAMAGNRHEEPSMSTGCVGMLVGACVQTVVTSLYLAYVLPLIMGAAEPMQLGVLFDNAGSVIWAGVLGGLGSLAVSLVPIIGRSNTVQTFVSGVIVARTLAGAALEQVAANSSAGVPYPGLLASVGFIIVAVVLGQVVMVAFTAAAASMLQSSLPFFMYMRYAALALAQQAAGGG